MQNCFLTVKTPHTSMKWKSIVSHHSFSVKYKIRLDWSLTTLKSGFYHQHIVSIMWKFPSLKDVRELRLPVPAWHPSWGLGSVRVSPRPLKTAKRCWRDHGVVVVSSSDHDWLKFRWLFHSIPFHSIPFHSIPFHSIPFHSILFHSIPFYLNQATWPIHTHTLTHKE